MCGENHADDGGTFPCRSIQHCQSPPILTSNCGEGSFSSDVPPLFHDPAWQCPVGDVCRKYFPREKQCALKGCDEKFKPSCHLMIFCGEECYHNSLLPETWEAVCETYQHTQSREKAKIRKKKYRGTKKGKEQRQRESAARYAKQIATRTSVKQPEDVIHPKPELGVSHSEKPHDVETHTTFPAPSDVALEGKSAKLDATEKASTPTTPSDNELRLAKHRAILKILFSDEPEPASISSAETITVPAGVIPRCCKALGCNEVVVPRSMNTEKRFCSRDCMNAFRNTFQNLKEAWKATRCPLLKLLVILFKQL